MLRKQKISIIQYTCKTGKTSLKCKTQYFMKCNNTSTFFAIWTLRYGSTCMMLRNFLFSKSCLSQRWQAQAVFSQSRLYRSNNNQPCSLFLMSPAANWHSSTSSTSPVTLTSPEHVGELSGLRGNLSSPPSPLYKF